MAATPVARSARRLWRSRPDPCRTEPTTPPTTPTLDRVGRHRPSDRRRRCRAEARLRGWLRARRTSFRQHPDAAGQRRRPGVHARRHSGDLPGPLLPTMMRAHHQRGRDPDAARRCAEMPACWPRHPTTPVARIVADAPNTVLTINADGGTFVHSAYALGIGQPGEPAPARTCSTRRRRSQRPRDGCRSSQPRGRRAVRADRRTGSRRRVIGPDELSGQEPAPTIVDWPAESGVSLADATTCARVDAAASDRCSLDAKQNTYFTEGDVTYQLAVARGAARRPGRAEPRACYVRERA